MTPVARLDWIDERADAHGTSSPSSFAGADGNRLQRTRRRPTETTTRRDRLRDDDRDERLGDTHGSGDDDGEQSERGRSRLVDAPQVVAAVQEQRRRADVLGRLHEREQRGREKRLLDAVGVEDLIGERRERTMRISVARSAADELEQEHLPKEASQPPPVLRRRRSGSRTS